MELKRILARDSRSANEKAIQLYGKEVLIISSQRLDNQTELIVAVDLDALGPRSAVSKSAPSIPAPCVPAQVSAQAVPHLAVPRTALADQTVDNASDHAGQPAADDVAFVPFSKLFQSASAFAPLPSDDLPPEPAVSIASAPMAPAPAAAAPMAFSGSLPPEAAPVLANESQAEQLQQTQQTQQTHQDRHDHQRNQEIVEMMRLEMAALRKEFSLSRQMMPWQEGLRLSPAVQQLSSAMSEAGVPAGLRALLTDSIHGLDSEQEALPVMHSLLVNAMSRPVMAIPATGVHALCGPSGAGKTLMVGRLALAAAQTHGSDNQVMVSFADQRPGAWAQMQLLAAQSGVACYRAADSDTLGMLLEDLGGKTIWIDTCGTNFAAQAQLLLDQHPKVLRHAVLPVDATVTSVQKILLNSNLSWSSLMLSKVDEAAYPWALIKGLTEHSLPVSCMAGDGLIAQPPACFDADRLVKLALGPLTSGAAWSPHEASPNVVALLDVKRMPAMAAAPTVQTPKPVRRLPTRKAVATPNTPKPPLMAPVDTRYNMPSIMQEDILIPTLLGSVPVTAVRNKSTNARPVSKVAHG